MNDSPPGPTPSKVAMHSGLQGIAKRLVEHGVLTDTQATVAESTATELGTCRCYSTWSIVG